MFLNKAYFNGMNVPRAYMGKDLIFGKPIDFLAPYPDHRISMCLYADATGVRNWDSVNDQMPIKTINMAGIQKWEETEDYIIYLDKDAVMTIVEQYVTGAYDKFQEVKALVDTSTEMLVENGIEWTTEDDSKLFTDINDSMLEEILNTPTQLDESTEIQTFESKAVPTTYECCLRTDKKSGEIYIGEGYENIDGVVPSGKPFVKSIMPSGKLEFATSATDATHTTIVKDKVVPQVVTRGLIEHFDFADGKGTEATLKSRVSDNVLTLSGFNFDANSGWTGKGLKFDGVDDKLVNYPREVVKTIELKMDGKIASSSWQVIISNIKHYSNSTNIRTEGINFPELNIFPGDINAGKNIHLFLIHNDDGSVRILNAVSQRSMLSTNTLEKLEIFFNSLGRQCTMWHSIKIYNVALTEAEIARNYEYEQSIDRTSTQMLPDNSHDLSYGIGDSAQLSDEQKSTFRLSLDGSKFVAGMRYCEGLEVVGFTYADVQVEMEKEEWVSKEEVTEESEVAPTKTIEEPKVESKSKSINDELNYVSSFKQMLVYKGNLTEAELIAENEKEIRLRKPFKEYTISRDENLETTTIEYGEVI